MLLLSPIKVVQNWIRERELRKELDRELDRKMDQTVELAQAAAERVSVFCMKYDRCKTGEIVLKGDN